MSYRSGGRDHYSYSAQDHYRNRGPGPNDKYAQTRPSYSRPKTEYDSHYSHYSKENIDTEYANSSGNGSRRPAAHPYHSNSRYNSPSYSNRNNQRISTSQPSNSGRPPRIESKPLKHHETSPRKDLNSHQAVSTANLKREQIKRTYDSSKFPQQRHNLLVLKSIPLNMSEKQYKLISDPMIKKESTKLEYRYEGGSNLLTLKDPRFNYPNYPIYERHGHKSNKRPPSSHPIQVNFKYDKNSVGPKPTNEVVVWNFPNTTPISHLRSTFRSYGSIDNIKTTDDPVTAVPLGLCVVSFDGDIENAHQAALDAVEKTNGKLVIGGSKVKTGLNIRGKLHDEIFKNMMHQRKLAARKEREKEKLKELEKEKLKREQEKREMLAAKIQKTPKVPKVSEQAKSTNSTNLIPQIFSNAIGNASKGAINSLPLSSHDKHIKEVTEKDIPTGYERHIANRPFIFIPDKFVSTRDVNSVDIRKVLIKYNCDRILTHKTGFYVVFNDLKDAERCYDAQNGRHFMKYKMYMDFIVPKGRLEETKLGCKIGVIGQTKAILLNDYNNYLMKDLREKVIGAKILKCLENEKYSALIKRYTEEAEAKEEEQRKKRHEALSNRNTLGSNNPLFNDPLLSKTVNHSGDPALRLSSFRRNSKAADSHYAKESKLQRKMDKVPMAYALNFQDGENEEDSSSDENDDDDEEEEEEGDEEEDEEEEKNTEIEEEPFKASKKRQSPLETAFESSKKIKVEHKSSDELSSDDREDRVEVASEPTSPDGEGQEIILKKTTASKKKGSRTDAESVKKEDLEKREEEEGKGEEEQEEEEEESAAIDFSSLDSHFRPSAGIPTTAYEIDYSGIQGDLDGLQNIIIDEEDLKFAKRALEKVPEETNVKNIDYWSWKIKEAKRDKDSTDLKKLYEELDVLHDPSLDNTSGSFRTEGYKKIQEKEKKKYLPYRRNVDAPLNTIQDEDDINNNTTNSNSNIHSSRVNRANNRRFVADISAQKQILGSETDILDLNHLTKRKKPVQFARSAIHNWGLYALEPIAAREMIIEYVGERIRQQVAECREKKYLKSGIGSSYLFRIDENTVIDASKKGGIARFINHCCVPSCTAKIIKVEGKKRIVIYALRDIGANEELTYDYKFERETNDDERIPCLCGAPGCKGYLN